MYGRKTKRNPITYKAFVQSTREVEDASHYTEDLMGNSQCLCCGEQLVDDQGLVKLDVPCAQTEEA